MKNNVPVSEYRVKEKRPSIVTGVIMAAFGISGLGFSIIWLLPQTIALPVQFPDEMDFRFFNGAITAYAIVSLSVLIMGICIIKENGKARAQSTLRLLQLVAGVAIIICILLMIASPLIYNIFLCMGLIPVGIVWLVFTASNGLPKVKTGLNVTWRALVTATLVAVIPVAIFAGYTMYSYTTYSIQNDKYAEAADFKKFEVECLDGSKLDENIFKEHKLTMVNCWETICGPCITEMPSLEKIYQENDNSDFTIIGICCDCIAGGKIKESTVSDAKAIVGAGITYPVAIPSPELEKGILYDITAFPTTFFVDSNGNVVKAVMGAKEKKEWEEIIEECLETVDSSDK